MSTILFGFLWIILNVSSINAFYVTGVTLLPNHPRSDLYRDFFFELIEQISQVGGFTANLQTLPEQVGYGGQIGETQPKGLIGEIYNNNADFILTDMEITPERSQFVDFTRPYLTGKLAALVKRTDADVQNGVDENEESDLFKVLRQNKVAVINGSLVERFWKTFDHSIVSLPNLQTGIDLIKSDPNYALVSDTVRLGLIAMDNCDLKMLISNGNQFQSYYAIALPKDSPYFAYFNSSLKVLEENGNLEDLTDIFAYTKCQNGLMDSEHLALEEKQKLAHDLNSAKSMLTTGHTILLIGAICLATRKHFFIC